MKVVAVIVLGRLYTLLLFFFYKNCNIGEKILVTSILVLINYLSIILIDVFFFNYKHRSSNYKYIRSISSTYFFLLTYKNYNIRKIDASILAKYNFVICN